MNTLGRVHVRMKLEDFTDKKVEEKILGGLENVQQISQGMVSLILWFDDEDSSINLKEVVDSMIDAHHWKTSIIPKSKIKESDFVWFDMRSWNDKNTIPDNFRFCYRYNNTSQIVDGLQTLSDAITFFKNKPPKEKKIERKQKRNDI